VFCVNDQDRLWSLARLFRKGLSVPGDVSVVGFDDLPASLYRVPPLTSGGQSIGISRTIRPSHLDLMAGTPRLSLRPWNSCVRESTARAGKETTEGRPREPST